MPYVDVHTHLTHADFKPDIESIISRAQDHGLGAIICNGLDPDSNREVLELSKRFSIVEAALGIYPINAACEYLPKNLPYKVPFMDVNTEISFIDDQAASGRLIAIGECGLDAYWLEENSFAAQEEVFERLIDIGIRHNLPIIVHNRKLEQRSMDILRSLGAKRVDFHCYGGKVKLALKVAEHEDWCFSIPANARRNGAFKKMLECLPPDKILTETDAPYMSPTKNTRNEPSNVTQTVEFLAELRGWDIDEAKNMIWKNYCRLFSR